MSLSKIGVPMKWIKCTDEAPPGDKGCDLRIITWDGYTVRENIRRFGAGLTLLNVVDKKEGF